MRKNCYNESVTSVGNSWVVCRSKSHPGRIYYFNTLTGKAAWNLSEAEIEKAKKTTKIIENTGVRIEGYPEPSDPPHDQSYAIHSSNKCANNMPNANAQKIYNNPILNNQPKQQHLIPPFTGVQCSCNHSNPMNSVGLGIPIASGLNPNIWNIPVAQQLLLANTIPPLLSHAPSTIINMPNKVDGNEIRYVQSTSVPLNKRFKNEMITDNSYNSSKTGIRKFNTRICNKTGIRSFRHCSTPNFKNDLRQLLSTRRRRNSSSKNTSLLNTVPQNSDTETCDKEESDNLQEDADELIISSQIKFNVSGLKNIAKHNIDQDLWYIVTDTNVLLNHHRFIKILLDSDKECRLKVPEHVITEIRNASRSSNIREMNHARRAMSFLSQNIRAGLATIAKDPLIANNTGKSYILDCCLNLINENYHIVLLCNDKELQNHEKAISMPMFTVNEIKAFLSTSAEDDDTRPSAIPLSNEPLIKITIPNNQTDVKNENVTQSQKIQLTPIEITEINQEKRKTEAISVGVHTNNLTEVRTMVNVGVQTEFFFNQSSQTSTQNGNQPISVTNFKNSDDKQDELDSDGPSERKEIKLNHTTSNQSSKNADDIIEKTNFKWRRKRRRSLLECFNVPYEQEMNISHASNSAVFNKRLKQGENSELEKQSPGHVSSNSESQVSVSNHQSFVDNVIEETSTSGIISNTNSNNDSDNELAENSQKDISISCSNKETGNCKNVMFEITNQAMEENLKTRCDEWVSRFIQIMEEVLTQILQKDPLCFPYSLSPPWTLFEATQCIKMKFRMDCDIIDAATKLSEALMKISDKKGTININMNPNMYMEMYSFGVYLIDTLQAANNDSEDLQTAAESLAKLLSDIQNPNADTSHNDSFADITREDEVVSDKSNVDNTDTEIDEHSSAPHQGDLNSPEKPFCTKSLDSPLKYNLRSQWKRTVQKNKDETEVRFITTDPETTFFSSLNLQKKNEANETEVYPVIEPHTPSCDPPIQSTGLIFNNKNHESNDKNIVNEDKSPMQMEVSEPKIIRNFTKCLEFEEKLKNKEKETLGLDELHNTTEPCLDYEYTEDDYISQDEYDIYDERIENDNGNEFLAENGHNMPLNVGGNHKFKPIIRRSLREIRETFLVIYAFCEESQKRLIAEPEKNHGEILIKAKETHSHINKLCSALNSICNRDAKTPNNNIASILKSEGIELEETDLQEYRALMAKCENQANILRETVETIMYHVER